MIEALLWGLGLVMVVEGLVYVLAPHAVEDLLERLKSLPLQKRRNFGGLCAMLGLLILYSVQRFL